jgi:hypothetical protein
VRPKLFPFGAALWLVLLLPGTAQAQDSVLMEPMQSPDYDRGRNVSVTEKPREDYDAQGVRRGAFLIYPRLGIGAGVSDNVYLTPTSKTGDVYALLSPSINIQSDWSIHQLSLQGGASLRRYADETVRNQDEWYVNALGRVDVGGSFALVGETQFARTQESPFTGSLTSSLAALSSYQRQTAVVRGQYTSGRSRVSLSYDLSNFKFSDIVLNTGAPLTQRDRDRSIQHATGQVERALSPSFSIYGEVGYSVTDYAHQLLNGTANRDSQALRGVVGVHLDLSSFIRGNIGAGYVRRTYRSPLYKDVSGLSIEAKLEYFPTELTTVTLDARRLLDDSSIGGVGAFFDNRVGLRIDHEVRRNLLGFVSGGFSKQDYVDSSFSSDIYQATTGSRYLISRSASLQATLGYASRSQVGLLGGNINELSAELQLVLQR